MSLRGSGKVNIGRLLIGVIKRRGRDALQLLLENSPMLVEGCTEDERVHRIH